MARSGSLDRDTADEYDVVVIGAGIAGLTAAAYLARSGARVLLCEQAAQAGGLFNSFWREGYLFDGGVKAIESSAVVLPMLSQLGLLDRVGLEPSPVALMLCRTLHPMCGLPDVEAYFSSLGDLFPADREGLQRVLRDATDVFYLLDALLAFPIPFFAPAGSGRSAQAEWLRAHRAVLFRVPRALALMRREYRAYLEWILQDPRLVNLLAGLFPDGTSVFFGLGYLRMFLDYYYPRGGIGTIPRVLADAVREWGGAVRLNTRVERIVLQGAQACGVQLASGEEIRAGHIVAACDLRQALVGLLPPGTLDARFERRLRGAEVSHSVFNLFLGLDLPAERLGLQEYGHTFLIPDLEGIGEDDRRHRNDYFRHVPLEVSVPCLQQPDLAPPGMTGLVASAMASWEYGEGWEGAPVDYAALKERCTRDMMANLEQSFPGISEHVVLSFAATPGTIARLTSSTEGAIMGWSYRRERTLSRGNALQMRSSIRTPVPRLFVAGQWAFSPGGAPTAVLTGKLAAEAVLRHESEER